MSNGRRVEYLQLQSLKQDLRNARTHPKKQLRQLAASIRRFGFNNPIIVDETNVILAGHGRVAAARQLDMAEVPCIRLAHMTAADKRAYRLADNKLAMNAGWDEELLAEELRTLIEIDPEFDLDLTGFSTAEMDSLIEGLTLEEPGDLGDDRLPGPGRTSRVKEGDIWRLGPRTGSFAAPASKPMCWQR
jgi:ParB-like chromosome segregation protein Spo0J